MHHFSETNIFQGVIVTALSYYMQMWTIAKRGPVFLAMSMPLTFVFTIVISSSIIGDAVSLGRFVREHFLIRSVTDEPGHRVVQQFPCLSSSI